MIRKTSLVLIGLSSMAVAGVITGILVAKADIKAKEIAITAETDVIVE